VTSVVPAPVREFFELLNDEDWDGLASLWAEESELRAVGTRPRFGHAEIMDYYRNVFQPWSAHVDVPSRFMVDGPTVVVEIRFRGTTHTGQQIEFDAVDVFDIAHDRIKRLTSWYDLLWVRKQL
jgi:ketosteroid isomerase-like protein